MHLPDGLPEHRARADNNAAPRVGDISNPEAEQHPFIGMTKAQALARCGEAKKHTVTDEGENWIYLLNMGEVIGKAFIPFNFKTHAGSDKRAHLWPGRPGKEIHLGHAD